MHISYYQNILETLWKPILKTGKIKTIVLLLRLFLWWVKINILVHILQKLICATAKILFCLVKPSFILAIALLHKISLNQALDFSKTDSHCAPKPAKAKLHVDVLTVAMVNLLLQAELVSKLLCFLFSLLLSPLSSLLWRKCSVSARVSNFEDVSLSIRQPMIIAHGRTPISPHLSHYNPFIVM